MSRLSQNEFSFKVAVPVTKKEADPTITDDSKPVFHRFRGAFTFDAITTTIESMLPTAKASKKDKKNWKRCVAITYVDEDGDAIRISSEDEWDECLRLQCTMLAQQARTQQSESAAAATSVVIRLTAKWGWMYSRAEKGAAHAVAESAKPPAPDADVASTTSSSSSSDSGSSHDGAADKSSKKKKKGKKGTKNKKKKAAEVQFNVPETEHNTTADYNCDSGAEGTIPRRGCLSSASSAVGGAPSSNVSSGKRVQFTSRCVSEEVDPLGVLDRQPSQDDLEHYFTNGNNNSDHHATHAVVVDPLSDCFLLPKTPVHNDAPYDPLPSPQVPKKKDDEPFPTYPETGESTNNHNNGHGVSYFDFIRHPVSSPHGGPVVSFAQPAAVASAEEKKRQRAEEMVAATAFPAIRGAVPAAMPCVVPPPPPPAPVAEVPQQQQPAAAKVATWLDHILGGGASSTAAAAASPSATATTRVSSASATAATPLSAPEVNMMISSARNKPIKEEESAATVAMSEPLLASSPANNNRQQKLQDVVVASDDELNKAIFRARLVSFYEQYNPEKLSCVDKTIALYGDKQDELFAALEEKYCKPSTTTEDVWGEEKEAETVEVEAPAAVSVPPLPLQTNTNDQQHVVAIPLPRSCTVGSNTEAPPAPSPSIPIPQPRSRAAELQQERETYPEDDDDAMEKAEAFDRDGDVRVASCAGAPLDRLEPPVAVSANSAAGGSGVRPWNNVHQNALALQDVLGNTVELKVIKRMLRKHKNNAREVLDMLLRGAE